MVNILESLGVGAVEENTDINPAFRSKGDPPLALGEAVSSLLYASNYKAGLMSFGLEALPVLTSGPLSKPRRPNAIRGFFLSAGLRRKTYFARINSLGWMEKHLDLVCNLYQEAATLWSSKGELPAYLRCSFSLLNAMTCLAQSKQESGQAVALSVLRYIALLPLAPPATFKNEVLSIASTRAQEKPRPSPGRILEGAFISKSRKDLILAKTLVDAVACTPSRQGYQSFFLGWNADESYYTDVYFAIPVKEGIFLASRLQYPGTPGLPAVELSPEDLLSEPLARDACWEQRVEIMPPLHRQLRIPRKTLKEILNVAGIESSAATPGPRDCIPSNRGLLVCFKS